MVLQSVRRAKCLHIYVNLKRRKGRLHVRSCKQKSRINRDLRAVIIVVKLTNRNPDEIFYWRFGSLGYNGGLRRPPTLLTLVGVTFENRFPYLVRPNSDDPTATRYGINKETSISAL